MPPGTSKLWTILLSRITKHRAENICMREPVYKLFLRQCWHLSGIFRIVCLPFVFSGSSSGRVVDHHSDYHHWISGCGRLFKLQTDGLSLTFASQISKVGIARSKCLNIHIKSGSQWPLLIMSNKFICVSKRHFPAAASPINMLTCKSHRVQCGSLARKICLELLWIGGRARIYWHS